MARFTSSRRGRAEIVDVSCRAIRHDRRLGLEILERRDCPAVVSVLGGGQIAEAGESQLLTVRLSSPATKAVQVGYQITGHSGIPAVEAADYRLTLGATGLPGPSGTIVFRPGETVKQVRVAAVDDSLREGPESLRFTLFRPRGCSVDGASSSADIIVRDNDDYTAAIVPQESSRISEGSATSFVIELSSPATKSETFFVSTQDGSATTADYRPLRDMPVTLFAGQTRSLPFTLASVDDEIVEDDEFFLVTARPRSVDMPTVDPQGVAIVGASTVSFGLTVSNVSLEGGNPGITKCTFTVGLSAPVADGGNPVVVQYTTADGSLKAPDNYIATSGSLTFTRGQVQKTVTVSVKTDAMVGGVSSFQLIASALVGGASYTSAGTCTVDSGFQITLDYATTWFGPVPRAVREACEYAARKWSSVLVGDLPAVNDPDVGLIDDFRMTIGVGLLDYPSGEGDGPGKVLANATFVKTRQDSSRLPYMGITGIDPSDIDRPELKDIVLHEMGHALGFSGSFDPFKRYVVGAGFTGPNAVREYQKIFGTTAGFVPLEAGGGAGTAGSHWSESVFRTELMTGYVDPVMQLSRVTVGAMQDLGYRVNYAAADTYRPPAGVTPPAAASRSANIATAMAWILEHQRVRPVLRAAAFARLA